MKNGRNGIAALAVALLGITASGAQAQQQTIADLVVANQDFETLETALSTAGLVSTFQGSGKFTVFAPTDAAFAQLPAGALEGLLQQKAQLAEVLKYHVVQGELTASALQGRSYVTTLQGQRLPVRVANGMVMVGGATVTSADVQASNGVVHVINGVLMPSMPVEKGY